MPSFRELLAKQAVPPQATIRYTFDTLRFGGDEDPVLVAQYADAVPAFKSAIAKFDPELKAHSSSGVNASPEMAKTRMRRLAEMIGASGVVTSWEHVCEEPGVLAPCTPDKVTELLVALTEDDSNIGVFVSFVSRIRNPDNFRPKVAAAAALGKE